MRDFEKTENALYEKLQEKLTEKQNGDKMVTAFFFSFADKFTKIMLTN